MTFQLKTWFSNLPDQAGSFRHFFAPGFAISKPRDGLPKCAGGFNWAGCFGRLDKKDSSDDLAVPACKWCRWYLYRPSYLWYLSYDSGRTVLRDELRWPLHMLTLRSPISLSLTSAQTSGACSGEVSLDHITEHSQSSSNKFDPQRAPACKLNRTHSNNPWRLLQVPQLARKDWFRLREPYFSLPVLRHARFHITPFQLRASSTSTLY